MHTTDANWAPVWHPGGQPDPVVRPDGSTATWVGTREELPLLAQTWPRERVTSTTPRSGGRTRPLESAPEGFYCERTRSAMLSLAEAPNETTREANDFSLDD